MSNDKSDNWCLPVIMMISLNHSSWTIGLATLDNLSGLIVDLKHPMFAVLVVQGSNRNVHQGNDALRSSLSRVLEIVKTTIVQHKPPTLPALPASALQWKDKLLIVARVEKWAAVISCSQVKNCPLGYETQASFDLVNPPVWAANPLSQEKRKCTWDHRRFHLGF